MTIRIEEVLFVFGLVALFYQWRWNVLSKRKRDGAKLISLEDGQDCPFPPREDRYEEEQV